MFGVLINIGSSSSDPNGRGKVLKDLTFQYLPIPEYEPTRERAPTYRELGFSELDSSDVDVHLDPEFESKTYGHIKRGFGDIKLLLGLGDDDVLFFYTNLEEESGWSPHIIGCFQRVKSHDCRGLGREAILGLAEDGFEHNAHLKRVDPCVDVLLKGGEGSCLFNRAIQLSDSKDNRQIAEPLLDAIRTPGGKPIRPGSPWYRWTLFSPHPERILRMAKNSESRHHRANR